MKRKKTDAAALEISLSDGQKEGRVDDSPVAPGDLERLFGLPVLAQIPAGSGSAAGRPLRSLRYSRRR